MAKNDPDQKTLAYNSLQGIPFVPLKAVLEPHRATLPPWSLSRCLSLFSRRHAKSGAGARLRPGARQIGCWPASPAGGTPDRAGDSGGLLAPPWGVVVSARPRWRAEPRRRVRSAPVHASLDHTAVLLDATGQGTRRRATTRRWGSSFFPCLGCGSSSSAPSSPRSRIHPCAAPLSPLPLLASILFVMYAKLVDADCAKDICQRGRPGPPWSDLRPSTYAGAVCCCRCRSPSAERPSIYVGAACCYRSPVMERGRRSLPRLLATRREGVHRPDLGASSSSRGLSASLILKSVLLGTNFTFSAPPSVAIV